ncbi:MAG TPA: hypothetical protein VEJ45_05505 [Candidatus Acidoferrales bacterium]|nr:hypothetical protein [Candidatus Acidoferrales bacterium]
MLKAASCALEGITILALLCAAFIRVKTEVASFVPTPAHPWIDEARGGDGPVEKQESIRRTFPVAARVIEVQNVFGTIEVEGRDGPGIQMDADKWIHAESNQTLDRAEREATLDIEQNPGLLRIAAKHPSGCALPDCWRFEDRSYRVELNVRLAVPHDSDLTLKTVDGGDLRVRNVRGTFSLSNVNGAVAMDRVSGSGAVRTVNGPIKVSFRENPRNDSQFASVNGSVDLYFAKNLSADFRCKTFSGSVYSDFPLFAKPVGAPTEPFRGAALSFPASSFAAGRAGSGGPLIRVDSLHGDVRIWVKHD